jgi:hypothetical protein
LQTRIAMTESLRPDEKNKVRALSFMRLLQFLGSALICVCSVVARAQSSASTMKAIVAHEYGGPEVLKYEDVPRPEPKEDQILVRVIAAGVNPVDASIRSGKYAKFGENRSEGHQVENG